MNNNFWKILAVTIPILVMIELFLGGYVAAAQVISGPYRIPLEFQKAYVELTQKIVHPEIPDSHLYRLGITMNENILDIPEMATHKSALFGISTCKDKEWIGGQSSFNAHDLVINPEPLPTELPEDMKLTLIELYRESGKTEAEIEAFLAKKLASYRKSKENLVKGQLDISIVNTPSVQAAFDYLLSQAVISSLPLEAIAAEFSEKVKVDDLGTIAYARGGIVRFIRDNIAVVIRGEGEFSREALDIARKIDAELLKQPLLTYEQLQARCPKLHVNPGGKIPETEIPLLEYSVEAPAGVSAGVSELKINGKNRGLQDHKIILEEKPKTVYVEAVVVSEELLVSTYEAEIKIPQ